MATRKTPAKPVDLVERPVIEPPADLEIKPVEAPPDDLPPVAEPAKDVGSFRDFMRQHEEAAQSLGVVVTKLTHPQAETGVTQGTYSGIRTFEGDPAAVYSDGSKH